ncbi:MAG: hypothetical protein ABIT71_14665 [Vicinamibacteraceae bacterium]
MRYPIAAAGLLASLSLGQAPAFADNMNVSVRNGHDVRTCEDLEVTFDGRPAVTAVDQLTAPGAQKLTVQASRNGGVYVFGEARQDFAITACKAAAPGSAGGSGSLEQVRASLSGGTLTATGPGSDSWIVYFIITAPKPAELDLQVNNGPLQVAHITGATTARSQNGPIKLLDVSGRVSARAENGPIAYEGGSGTIDLAAQNGPVAVRLAGSKWTSGSLTANAQNGPLALQVPSGFASGVRVRSSQHSPWSCQGCGDGRRTWDDTSRSVEFGSGPVAVTLSTVNGPVAVDLTR